MKNTAQEKKAILIILTSHDELGDTGKKTGAYLSEVSYPYEVFEEAGYVVDFASPRGGAAPLDGVNRKDAVNAAFLDDREVMKKLESTAKPSEVEGAYAGILFAGGHGTMWDFAQDLGFADFVGRNYEQGGVIGAVCHGVAGLLPLKSDGKWLIDGKSLTSFTNEEEKAVELEDVVPYLLESALVEKGAIHIKAPKFQKHVVRSERLVTGQNPASARGVAEEMVRTLQELQR